MKLKNAFQTSISGLEDHRSSKWPLKTSQAQATASKRISNHNSLNRPQNGLNTSRRPLPHQTHGLKTASDVEAQIHSLKTASDVEAQIHGLKTASDVDCSIHGLKTASERLNIITAQYPMKHRTALPSNVTPWLSSRSDPKMVCPRCARSHPRCARSPFQRKIQN